MDEDAGRTINGIKTVCKCVERATSARRIREICHGSMFVDFWLLDRGGGGSVCLSVCMCVMDLGAAVCVSDLHKIVCLLPCLCVCACVCFLSFLLSPTQNQQASRTSIQTHLVCV